MNDEIVSGQTRVLLWKSLILENGEETGYGLGWSVTVFDPADASDLARSMIDPEELNEMAGTFFVGHTGGSMGGITAFVLLPEAQVAVALVSNTSDVPGLSGRLLIAARLLAHRLASHPTVRAVGMRKPLWQCHHEFRYETGPHKTLFQRWRAM